MRKIQSLLVKLLYLPPGAAVPLCLAAAGLLIYVFAAGVENLLAYFAYALSAWAFAVLCAQAPKLLRALRRFRAENRYVRIYTSDARLRVRLSLYASVTMNVLYGLLQLGMGAHYRSIWHGSLAGYYGLLALMRFFLLRDTRRFRQGLSMREEWRRFRFCGAILLALNLFIAAMITYIVVWNRGIARNSILIIAMAAHTFFTMVKAIINILRYRRYESPVMMASKAINFAAALVSLMSLETSMLATFGSDGDVLFQRVITAITGLAICMLVLIMAIYMIVRATREIQRMKKESDSNEQ